MTFAVSIAREARHAYAAVVAHFDQSGSKVARVLNAPGSSSDERTKCLRDLKSTRFLLEKLHEALEALIGLYLNTVRSAVLARHEQPSHGERVSLKQ